MNEAVWLELTYLNEYGRVIQHTASANDWQGVYMLLERYRIHEENVLTFTVNGKPHNLSEGERQ